MNDHTSAFQRFARDAAQTAPTGAAAPLETVAGDDAHPSKAYGGLWSRRDMARTLELRPLDPMAAADALEYSYLARVQWNAAAGVITLLYQPLGVRVIIQGIGLFDLKEKLRQHLVTWVQEQGGDPVQIQAARMELGREFIWVQRIRLVEDPTGL